MQIRVEHRGNITIMHLDGKLFLENLKVVLDEWDGIIARDPKVIAVDCSKLISIDSSSIGTLVRFFNEAMSKNIELVFYDINSSIKKLFFTIHLEKFFLVMTGKKFEAEYLNRQCTAAG